MKKIITLNVLQVDEGSETIETPYLLSGDEFTDREKSQIYEDTELEVDNLMPVKELPIHIKELVVERFKEMGRW